MDYKWEKGKNKTWGVGGQVLLFTALILSARSARSFSIRLFLFTFYEQH